MNPNGTARRIARLTSEADQSAGPAMVLLTAALMWITVLGLNTLVDATTQAPDDASVGLLLAAVP